MQGVADFLVSLLAFSVLVALSLVLGGVVWGVYVLRAGRGSLTPDIVSRCVKLLFVGAVGIGLAQPAELGVTAWFLGQVLHQSPFPAFFHTPQFLAGMIRTALAVAVVGAAAWLRRRPEAGRRWALVTVLAILLAASGAWLSHAVDRFDDRARLMVLTALHQAGGAIWLGGLLQLGAAWRLIRRRLEHEDCWPVLLSRFSTVAMTSVLLAVVTGSFVAWPYIARWENLVGTLYGLYVMIKIALLAVALGLAALNLQAVRRWRATRRADESLQFRVPFFVEAETIFVLTIVLVASALLALPLSVDEDAANQRATGAEIAEILKPKWPRLISPSHAEVIAAGSPLSPTNPGEHDARNSWSEFNHDVAGLSLVVMAILALAAWTKRWPWTRHWPLGFVALTVFLVIRSDPTTWPLGSIGLLQGTFGDVEVLQHRLATLVAAAIGLVEWRVRSAQSSGRRLAYLFPALCIAGGLLLLVHFHSAFSEKYVFLIAVSHAPVGVLGVVMGCTRWLELRLPSSPAGRLSGFASVLAFLLFGLVLTFYREIPGA